MISNQTPLLLSEEAYYIPPLLHYIAMVPVLGVTAQWIAWRTKLPGILLLLLMGIALGIFIRPDDVIAAATEGSSTAGARVLFPLVSLSVAIIMFEGGLSLRLNELREAGTAVFRLVTVGALITLVLTALAAYFILGFDKRISLLVGAILVVTGPTVISPLLRQIRPSKRVESTLKWEGIVIDPIGAVLAVLVFEEFMVSTHGFAPLKASLLLLKTAAVGIAFGWLGAIALMQSYRRYWVPDFLQGILALALALFLFSLSNVLAEESGLITVTVLGIILANQKQTPIVHVIEFKEHLRTLLIGCLFIVLGSRIKPAELFQLGWQGLAFVVVVILLIRPIASFLCLAGTPLNSREKLFVGGMAPRGIVAASVASVFALKIEGMASGAIDAQQGSQLVSVTFLVILSTVTVYGLFSGPLARFLGLANPNPQGLLIAGADYWVRELCKVLKECKVSVLLVDTNYNKVSAARMDGLSAECLNILSDRALDEINFGNIGRLLALTPNDEVNSLAVQEFRHLFTRAGVFQLTFKSHASAQKRSVAQHLQGRLLFGNDCTFTKLRELVELGATFKATRLTESFSYRDFITRYGDSVIVMFVLNGSDVIVNSIDRKLNPNAGDVLISLVPAVTIPPKHPAISDTGNEQSHDDSQTRK